jgi:mono/diheme cytochrome c family protein
LDPLIRKVLWFGGAYLAVAAAAVGYFWLTGAMAERTGPDPETVARGRALYGEHCGRCHGERLEGQAGWQTRRANGTVPPPPLDASGHAWQHSDRQLFDMIKLGGALFARRGETSEMPAYRTTLSDAEIWAVIAAIKDAWPEETRLQQFRANLLGSFEHH